MLLFFSLQTLLLLMCHFYFLYSEIKDFNFFPGHLIFLFFFIIYPFQLFYFHLKTLVFFFHRVYFFKVFVIDWNVEVWAVGGGYSASFPRWNASVEGFVFHWAFWDILVVSGHVEIRIFFGNDFFLLSVRQIHEATTLTVRNLLSHRNAVARKNGWV